MAEHSHIYRRGNQFWFRTSVTVAPGKRVDVRHSLNTDSLFVATKLSAILKAARATIAGQEQHVFGFLSKLKAAGSSPAVSIDDMKPVVKSYFVDALRSARRQRADIDAEDWHGEAHRLGWSMTS